MGAVLERVFVLDRVSERHPDVQKEDAVYAWMNCLKSMQRVGKEPEEHVGIGFDRAGRLLEIVAIRGKDGSWLVKHAQTPPQERVRKELGLERRKS